MYAWVEGIFLDKDGSMFENFSVARVLTWGGGGMSTSNSRSDEDANFLRRVRPTISESEVHKSEHFAITK